MDEIELNEDIDAGETVGVDVGEINDGVWPFHCSIHPQNDWLPHSALSSGDIFWGAMGSELHDGRHAEVVKSAPSGSSR